METELSLLQAAKRMDKAAIVKIFELYASPLYNYALRLCGDSVRADHIVGDVFAKLLERFASGNGPTSNLRSYLYEMVYHIIVDEARSLRRWAPLEALMSFRHVERSGQLSLEDHIVFEMILNAIQHDLKEDQRQVIVLRFLEEFSLHETAAILGKEIGHVKVIQSRALAKLRQIFETRESQTALSHPRIRKLSKALSTR
jgi:RNA polymerase sigma-70 factor, ECF subfamily